MMKEYKKRYKMYKSGKHWVTAPILFIGSVAVSFAIAESPVLADGTSQASSQETQTSVLNVKTGEVTSSAQTETDADDADARTAAPAAEQTAETEADNSVQRQTVENNDQSETAAGQSDTQNEDVQSEKQKDDSQTTTQTAAVQDENTTEQNSSDQNQTVEQTSVNAGQRVVDDKKPQGFQKGSDGSTVYYDVHGNQVKGQKNIDGKWYLFDETTGAMKTGFQKISSQNKTVYYSDMGQMQYGQQKISSHWYLFDETTGAMKTGLQYIADQKKLVVYASNGQMQYGTQRVGGKSYSFNRTTGALQARGQQKINGNWYMFDNKGRVLNGFQYIANQKKTVYYDAKTAQMQYGQKKINGKWYLFDGVTGSMKTGFQKISSQNKTVYYARNGQMQYGQQKIGGKWYLFDGVTGSMKTGFQKIANQNKTVYYASNGQMQYGQKKINGNWYLFDGVTGSMKTGFQWIANQKKTVYYDKDGCMKYGQQYINGKWYLFDGVTGSMKKGLHRIANQNKTVYYASNGQMQYGQQKVNGKWYLFDKVTGAMKTGLQYIADQKKLVLYGSNGQMQYGTQKVDGKKYNFNRVTGALEATGQQKINGKWYLFDNRKKIQTGFQRIANQNKTVYYDPATAQMKYGQQRIDGKWYLFDGVTGSMKTGFQKIANQNKTVYYDGNGHMQYSWQNINGKTYYFDGVTGKMATGHMYIDGGEYFFDVNGILVRDYSKDNDNYRADIAGNAASEMKKNYGASVDYDWNNQNDEYHAFTMNDTAQLLAMGQLKNDAAAIETNLKNNAFLSGGVVKSFVRTEKSDYSDSLKRNNVSAFINSLKGVSNLNDTILGVGAYSRDGQITTSFLLFSEHVPTHITAGNESKSSTVIKVEETYKDAGVNVDVRNGIKKGDTISTDDFGTAFSKIDSKALTGKAGEAISEDNLKLIFASLPGNESALEGTKNYYSNNDAYHYQFWLQGQTADQKQYNFLNANKGAKYGDKLVLPYTVTLVWGQAAGQTASGDEKAPTTGKSTSQMTAQEVDDAFKNGTETGLRFEQVKVNKVNGMKNETIRGLDVSSYVALKRAGVKFYDFDGNEASLMKVLKDAGANWVRIKLWNDPYDADNQSYGGGVSDEASMIEAAREASSYGLKVLLDFHYSDFWADPATQIIPKAWSASSSEKIEQSVYNYTKKVLSDCRKNGIDISMVQVGNEITKGILGVTGGNVWKNSNTAGRMCGYLNAGSKAVRETYRNAQVALHLETPNINNYDTIMTAFRNGGVDYDVLGSSYYPFWGYNSNNPSNISNVEKMVKNKYGKKFVILETGWPATLKDSDGTSNNIGGAPGHYNVGPQGQVDELSDLYKAVLSNDNGLGAFYWEPAWIAVKPGWKNWAENKAYAETMGTGWASSHSRGYYPDSKLYWRGQPTWGGSSWDNNTLFDPSGHPLQSLMMYKGFLEGYQSPDMTPKAHVDTNVSFKVDKIWNSDNVQVNGALQEGAVLNASELQNALPDAARQLLNGEKDQLIGKDALKKAVESLGGFKSGVLTKSFFDKDGNEYKYELWLEGQTDGDKEWNVLNDNNGIKYGGNLTVRVNATLKLVKAAEKPAEPSKPAEPVVKQATSSVGSIKVYKAWNSAGEVKGALSDGDTVDVKDVEPVETAASARALTGEKGASISEDALNQAVTTFAGYASALKGTRTYTDASGKQYHYEYWLAGQTLSDKQWQLNNANKDARYGQPITVVYEATLVEGPAESRI